MKGIEGHILQMGQDAFCRSGSKSCLARKEDMRD